VNLLIPQGSFYPTRQGPQVPAKRALAEPSPQTISKGDRGKDSKKGNKGKSLLPMMIQMLETRLCLAPTSFHREPVVHVEGQNLRNTVMSALDFFQLYFTKGLVGNTVEHTNSMHT